MKKDHPSFKKLKAQLAVIAPHRTDQVKAYWQKEGLSLTGIPDPDGVLGKLYGQEWSLIKLGRMPALFVVGQKGTLAFAQYAKHMADIPANSDLIRILEGLR